MTRFAILGFGHHAERRLVPAFQHTAEATLTGFWRRNSERAAEDAQTHNLHAFTSAEELCASPEVDAVFITSPDANHLADAELAFAHGKAVLCEKPVAINAGQAQQMLAASEAAGCFFGVAQNFRFNRSLEWVREAIAQGRIGRPQLANAQFCYLGTRSPRAWITDPTLATGGPVADVGVHCIDALRFLLADEVKSVSVLAAQDEASGEVEAFAALQMRMAGGVFANVTVSARAPYRTAFEVTGSEGILVVENGLTVDRPVEITLRKAGEVIETHTVTNGDAYSRMIDSFSLTMRGQGSYSAGGADGLINQRVLDAAFRSWHSGLRENL